MNFILHLISSFFEKISLNKKRIPVLMYHSVEESGDIHSVSPEKFEKQMKLLFKKDYKTITLSDLRSYLKNKTIPRKKVLVTFDDGYKNNLTVAKPILDKYGFKATVFVSTSFIGEELKRNQKTYQMLSQSDIGGLEKAGWDIANHFHSHCVLTELTDQKIEQEIKESKKILRDLLIKKENILSFVCPKDKTDKRVIDILLKSSANLIFTGHGLVSKNTSFYKIPRVEVFSNTDKYKFLMRLTRLYSFLKKHFNHKSF